ncbi:hypothetical protein GSF24_16180, partial [Microbispora triticiradicis]|nr:hypothetical protein [Microbispora triticiradicis]
MGRHRSDPLGIARLALVGLAVVLLLGYFLGSKVEGIDKYILPGVFVVIVLSIIPIVREVMKSRR